MSVPPHRRLVPRRKPVADDLDGAARRGPTPGSTPAPAPAPSKLPASSRPPAPARLDDDVDPGASFEMTVQRFPPERGDFDPGASFEMTIERSPIRESEAEIEVMFDAVPMLDGHDGHDITARRIRKVTLDDPGASFSDLEPTNVPIAPVRLDDEPPVAAPDDDALEDDLQPEIEDRPTTNLDPGERGLLAAIAEGVESSRLIYAEWLARHGEAARAEYLRVEHERHNLPPGDPRFEQCTHRLREVAARISMDWRSRVARSLIEGCTAIGQLCPQRWSALPASDGEDVRVCGQCHKHVYYCATIELARVRVADGDPVAVDATCDRWPGDLGAGCVQCGSFAPSDARFCPHCGQSMQQVIGLSGGSSSLRPR